MRFPVSVMLVMIKPLLKKAAKGGKPLVVIIIIAIKMNEIGIIFRKPPIRRISLVPIAWMMPPANRNPRPSKKAWLTIWTVSYTHLRAHETDSYLVCRLLLE